MLKNLVTLFKIAIFSVLFSGKGENNKTLLRTLKPDAIRVIVKKSFWCSLYK